MASSQVETVSTTADKAKLSLAVALVLASLVSFYLLAKQGQLAQWAALLACLAAAIVVFMSSEVGRPNNFFNFTDGVPTKSQKLLAHF